MDDSPSLLVDSAERLSALLDEIASVPRIGVDLEANGMFAYRARICLVQLAWQQGHETRVAVVDTLAVPTERLAELLGSRNVQKVIHDVSFDARLLAAEGVSLSNVLDTHAAAGLLGLEGIGLGSLLHRFFGVKVDKKLQLSDWAIRPIDADMLEYLTSDVQYLLRLADELSDLIERKELSDELREEIAYRLQVIADTPADTRTPGEKVKRAQGITGRQRAVLDRVAEVREQIAQRVDRPPQVLINDRVLVAMSKKPPESIAALRRFGGSIRRLAAEDQRIMLRAVHEGLQAPAPRREQKRAVRAGASKPAVDSSVLKKRLNAFRAAEAQQRGISEQAVLPTHCLKVLLSGKVRTSADLGALPGFGKARAERYGEQLLGIVAEVEQSSDDS